MTEFTLPRPLRARNAKHGSIAGNIAYGMFILFCFWTGAQMLNLLAHAPGLFEQAIQQQNSRPRIEMGFAVKTVFGFMTVLAGSALLGLSALIARWNRYR